jgi:hypothetical protein
MSQTTTPKPRRNKRRLLFTLAGLAILLLLVAVVVNNVGPYVNVIFKSAQVNQNYDERVAAMTDAKKDFSKGETLVAGPVSLAVTSVSTNYQLDEKTAAYVQSLQDRAAKNRKSDFDNERYAWNEPNPQYVLIQSHLVYDANGYKETKYPSFDGFPLDSVLSTHIGQYDPVATWVNETTVFQGSNGDGYDLEKALNGKNEGTITYLFRVAPETPIKKLELQATIFSKVSNIVGTEGMPRRGIQYSIGLE